MKKITLILSITLLGFLVGCSEESDLGYYTGESLLGGNYQTSITTKTTTDYIANDGSTFTQDTTNEEYTSIIENIFINTSSYGVSTFSTDVDTAAYSNVRRYLNDGIIPNPNAVRIEEMVNYFQYDLDTPLGDEVIHITTEVSGAPWNPDHDLLMVGLKTEEIVFGDAPANNLVFLLDVSGSMNSSDKLGLLKNAMKLLVNQVRPQDKISIVTYAGNTGLILDGGDGNDTDAIITAIDNLTAGGSTAGGAGINLAYTVAQQHYIEGGNNRVILGTDGDFNVGVSTIEGLTELIEEKRDTGIFLSVLGFGTGNLKDDTMETLADKGNGVYYYIDSDLEARKVFIEELGGTLVTVAKDVKLQIEFNPLTVKGYRLIGYENRLLEYDDFNDDTKDAGDLGAGHEVIAFYELIPASSDEIVDSVDFEQPEELKYNGSNYSDELMTLSLRYKDPKSETSQLMEEITYVTDNTETPSETFRFASSVVEFGLLLRDSQFQFGSSFTSVIDRASQSLGTDEQGYRAQFIELVQTAMQMFSERE